MQRLIGVMANVITASAAHYLQSRAAILRCGVVTNVYRINIMHPAIRQPREIALFIFLLPLFTAPAHLFLGKYLFPSRAPSVLPRFWDYASGT